LNLVIDIGNTSIKAGLFANNKLLLFNRYKTISDLYNDQTIFKDARKCIIGSVVNGAEDVMDKLNNILPTTLFCSTSKIPLTNLYQSATTLGSDRIAASVGAYSLYPNNNVLVIDVGTCIKYNFTNNHNQYIGGAISPGILMRFKALNQHTSKLPLIDADFSFDKLIGTNTQESILSGVIFGSIAEIDHTISMYLEQYPNLICVLTGGDSEYLAKRLKNTIFAHQNLVLVGLNEILNCNF
jgi:type III pantothenate kinase